MKSNKEVYEIEIGDIRLYQCPHCKYEWLEFVDASDYPEYCPHCGEDLSE